VSSDAYVLQLSHRLELHSSAKSVAQIRLWPRAFRQVFGDALASRPAVGFLAKSARRAIVKKVQPERREYRRSVRRKPMSASPAIDLAPPVRRPDLIDHLKSSERLMTARELASILAISPKTIYSYAERNMIPHFKIEASVRFRGRDVAEWLYNHARLGRVKSRAK
jgi:excisionase family DNA binding protein